MSRSRLYAAYGSNMIVRQMVERCPRARLVGTGILDDHRFIITGDGVASVVQSDGDLVHVVVWAITVADEFCLDAYEGVALGIYRKRVLPVLMPTGTTSRLLTYIATTTAKGTPRPGYLESIIAAARRHGFPPVYLRELEGWSTTHRYRVAAPLSDLSSATYRPPPGDGHVD